MAVISELGRWRQDQYFKDSLYHIVFKVKLDTDRDRTQIKHLHAPGPAMKDWGRHLCSF